MSSKRLLILFSVLVALLTVAGAVSFVGYARRHAPNPQLAAVAPFDIFVSGLEPWRVRLAEGVTAQLDSMPPLAAVSQAVVRERWRGQPGGGGRPELAAVDLARRTSAGLAIYGRLDPIAASRDSVRVQMIVVDAGDGRVLVTSDRPWPVANLEALPRALAEQVRQNYRYPSD
ncbi:MAG TPA: hypothetical protein VGJ80_09430 [Gemmatimonadales bacterium]|jgi:hypothetical protein